MSTLAKVLLFAYASVCCIAANGSNRSCLWKLDRRVCALPLDLSISDWGSECVTDINMELELLKPYQQCGNVNLDWVWVWASPHEAVLSSLKFYNVTSEVISTNETPSVHYVQSTLSVREVVANFGHRRPSKLEFFFAPLYEDSGCNSALQCASKTDENAVKLSLDIKVDHVPILSFAAFEEQSVGSASIAGASQMNLTRKSAIEVALHINSSVENLVINVDALDEDVFQENKDAYEFSAIRRLDVSVFSMVEFYRNMPEVGSRAFFIPVYGLFGDTYRDNCRLGVVPSNWCEEGARLNITKNHVQAQFRFNITRLLKAAERKYIDRLSAHEVGSSFRFAKVVVKMQAVASSGSNLQVNFHWLALNVYKEFGLSNRTVE